MIKVKIIKKEKLVQNITIEGHAESAKYGKDLVCAAVSGIVTGFFNAIKETKLNENFKLELSEGKAIIIVKKNNPDVDLALKIFLIQINTVFQSNNKYIQIKGDI